MRNFIKVDKAQITTVLEIVILVVYFIILQFEFAWSISLVSLDFGSRGIQLLADEIEIPGLTSANWTHSALIESEMPKSRHRYMV